MVGKKINNYELRELVGDGAMGVVYLAEHPVLRRRVAVKLLKRQYLESPSLVSRFVNEARAAAAIHHPNVIEVIDVGLVEEEIPYIMMEYLDGEPLSRRLMRERMGIGKAVDITIQTARAVAASHALEIVHRDLKPENLFLVPDPMSPGGERVKVLDFGIAKLRPDWSGNEGTKTRTGVIFGTPAYMSPEQCRGLNEEVDAMTDVYALGCILYEMLCGHAPYISPGWGDVLMMHISDPIPVPSAENPRVPPAIDHVVVTALAKKKTDRFPSMREMNRALAQARNDVQDTPAPVTKTDPTLPAIVLGIDSLDGRATGVSGTRAAVARAPQDSIVAFEAFPPAPRRRLQSLVIAGSAAVGIVAAIALGVRYSGKTAQPPAVTVPAPAAAAPPGVPGPEDPRPAEKAAEPTDEVQPRPADTRPSPSDHADAKPKKVVAKSADAKSSAKSPAKSITTKSHHQTAKRKDPVKW